MTTKTILGLSGSLRKNSLNTALLGALGAEAPEGLAISVYDDGDVPLYNQDLEVPPSVNALNEAIAGADAVLWAVPEFNYSLPGGV